jgi:excisionase family DNA binding protein
MHADPDLDLVLTADEAELVAAAQRTMMACLDHSSATTIALREKSSDAIQSEATVTLPPKALRLIAQLLGQMARRQPIMLMPLEMELTTLQAAGFLNVSRPFLIKELEAKKLPYRLVGTHRRIYLEDLIKYKESMRRQSERAMQELADLDQELKLGY